MERTSSKPYFPSAFLVSVLLHVSVIGGVAAFFASGPVVESGEMLVLSATIEDEAGLAFSREENGAPKGVDAEPPDVKPPGILPPKTAPSSPDSQDAVPHVVLERTDLSLVPVKTTKVPFQTPPVPRLASGASAREAKTISATGTSKTAQVTSQSSGADSITGPSLAVSPRGQGDGTAVKTLDARLLGISPRYPRYSRQHGQEGRVVYRLWIDKDGALIRHSLEKSSGYSLLDEAALEALSEAHFNGSESEALIGITFKLEKK